MFTKRLARTPIIFLGALGLHLALAAAARAQAWVPLKGGGDVSFTYSNMYVRNHVDGVGHRRSDKGRIRTNSILVAFDYGLTDKLALAGDLAYVASKYIGDDPHGPDDTGAYHQTFQDAHIELRYNALKAPLVVTPFIGVTLPTHDYLTRGHSAAGRGFHELLLGVNVGHDLPRPLANGYVQARYAYAVLDRFEGWHLNRSYGDWELGWLAGRALSFRFLGVWQKTHGGLVLPPAALDEHEFEIHDRITQANYIHLGGGVGLSLNRSVALHAAYLTNTYARNTHAPGGVVLGISWSFARELGLSRIATSSSPINLLPSGRAAY